MSDRPNIILLVGEDTGRHQRCYGDPCAITPRIDALAAEGCRFTRAISHSPVCSPSRCGLVTGQYPTKTGGLHHRSRMQQPPRVFTQDLRDAGYFVAWPGKTDFNFTPQDGWRDSDQLWIADLAAGRLPKDRPWFVYQNLEVTHESGMWPISSPAPGVQGVRSDDELDSLAPQFDPATVPVPAYLPDTQAVREDVARYYHRLAVQDLMVGRVLDALDASGRRDDTLVIYLSDHGRGLPREKRWLYEAGIHLPLILRGPGVAPGSVRDDLVGWVDVAPTILSLAGAAIPKEYDGQVFFGPHRAAPRQYAYAARDRMDETQDAARAVRDERFLYIRNLHPDRPYLLPNRYMEHMPTLHSLRQQHNAGKLTPEAAAFTADRKPAEELYDTAADPDCVHNLAADASHGRKLAELRGALDWWLAKTNDLGLLPERDLIERGIIDDEMARLQQKYATGVST